MNKQPDPYIIKMLDISDNKEVGMTMISASTGKGKTFEVVRHAVKNVDNGRYKRVIFIEPRHSILEDVKKGLISAGAKGILYLQSSKDNTYDHIDEIDDSQIKDPVLRDLIKDLKECCSYSDKENEKASHVFDDIIFSKKSEIKKYCTRPKNKIDESDLNEIKKIFPEEIKEEHKFLLMTMDKIFHTLDILKKENRILSSLLFKEKTLVIVDELDKCYAIALNKLADNKDTLEDMLAVIQNAYAFISDTDNRWQVLVDEESNKKIEEEKKTLLKEINDLHKEYGILNNFVFEQKDEKSLELFVSRSQTFIASKNKSFKLIKDNQKTIVKSCSQRTDFSVIKMAISCRETVRHILNFIYSLGEAYRRQNHDASYEDGLYYGISQVFNKTLAESDYYLNYAMDNSIKTQSLRIDKGEFTDDKSVCNNGFSHCLFDNKPGTNHTYMTSSGIDLTPENIFIWMAKKTNVICMSATQQIPTVASLDLDYCKRVLGDRFDCYSRDDFEKANSMVSKKENIICDVITTFSANREKLYFALKNLLLEKNLDEKDNFKNLVYEAADAITTSCKNKDYLIDREFKRFYTLCKFAFEEKAVSGIIILNSYIYIDPYKKFIDDISSLYKVNLIDIKNIYIIKADNIRYKLNEIRTKLNNGEKCLVVSTKEAIGQGINIQYDKDFNFFYQEEPTNVFPVVRDGKPLTLQDQNKLVYLVMKMASNNEISDSDMRSWVSLALKNQNHESKKYKSIKNAKTSIFIQGLGRANRTVNKEDYEFIYFDEALCDVLCLSDLMVEKTPELLAVEEKVNDYKKNIERIYVESMSETERQLTIKSNKLQRTIETLLTTFTKENMINDRETALEKYKKILEKIYKYGPWPTKIEFEDKTIIEEIGYVHCDSPKDLYVLSNGEDSYCENLISVSFGLKERMHKLNWDSVLNLQHYKKPEGECWLINPKAFNLLQGIVGEKKFRKLFEEESDFYHLEEPSLDEFEVCGDFKVKNTNIYIDVKNFSESRGTIDISSFVYDKLEMIRDKNLDGKLIVVNVFAKGKYKYPYINDNDILVVSNVFKEYGFRQRENLKAIFDWIDNAKE